MQMTTHKKEMKTINPLQNLQKNSLKKIDKHTSTLGESFEQQQEFIMNFSALWHSLKLYGKKTQDFKSTEKLFKEKLSKYEGAKVNQAMLQYGEDNVVFPTTKQIIEIIQTYDENLKEQEKRHLKMYNRKSTLTKLGSYLVTPSDQEDLERYEKKYGEINLSEEWLVDFDEKFNNLENRGDNVE